MTDVVSRSQVSTPSAGAGAPISGPPVQQEWTGSNAMGADAPFYSTAPNPDATKRMLLVFFYFAPSAEVGVLRWMSLARYGAERGWAVDVVTLHPSFMGTLDSTRLTQLPSGVRLFGFSGEEPLWFRGLVGAWRRINGTGGSTAGSHMGGHLDGADLGRELTAADAPVWRRAVRSHVHFKLGDALVRRATRLGTALAQRARYDVVVSSGPPNAAHGAARDIAAGANVPFVMDMRDPWSEDEAMPEELRSAAWQRLARAYEERCVKAAAAVVVTSEAHEALQVKKYPFLGSRIRTVRNGADIDQIPRSRLGTRFVVAFAGMIYLGRDPRVLFRAAARVARETGASPQEFGVEFMGDDACNGVPLTTIARESELGEHFTSHGFRPRREALELLARAAVLVSLPLRTTMTLPAKLFEYMRFDAWLLALAEDGSATSALLRGTGADVVAPDDEQRIAEVLRARFDEFRAGRRPVALNHDGRFDRSIQSGRMYALLEEVAAARRAEAPTR